MTYQTLLKVPVELAPGAGCGDWDVFVLGRVVGTVRAVGDASWGWVAREPGLDDDPDFCRRLSAAVARCWKLKKEDT